MGENVTVILPSDHGPQLPRENVEQLAAITDDEEAADVHAAATAVVTAWYAYQHDASFPAAEDPAAEQHERLSGSIDALVRGLAAVPAGAPGERVIEAVWPVLGQVWTDRSTAAESVRRAVDELRYLAVQRHGLIQDCRRVLGR